MTLAAPRNDKKLTKVTEAVPASCPLCESGRGWSVAELEQELREDDERGNESGQFTENMTTGRARIGANHSIIEH